MIILLVPRHFLLVPRHISSSNLDSKKSAITSSTGFPAIPSHNLHLTLRPSGGASWASSLCFTKSNFSWCNANDKLFFIFSVDFSGGLPDIKQYNYKYAWNLFVLYFRGWTFQNKALFKQNKGHLGSRCIYIRIYVCVFDLWCACNRVNVPPSARSYESDMYTTSPTLRLRLLLQTHQGLCMELGGLIPAGMSIPKLVVVRLRSLTWAWQSP